MGLWIGKCWPTRFCKNLLTILWYKYVITYELVNQPWAIWGRQTRGPCSPPRALLFPYPKRAPDYDCYITLLRPAVTYSNTYICRQLADTLGTTSTGIIYEQVNLNLIWSDHHLISAVRTWQTLGEDIAKHPGRLVLGIWIGQYWPQQDYVTTILLLCMLFRTRILIYKYNQGLSSWTSKPGWFQHMLSVEAQPKPRWRVSSIKFPLHCRYTRSSRGTITLLCAQTTSTANHRDPVHNRATAWHSFQPPTAWKNAAGA